jgi:cysteine-rich repeat protein
MGTIAPGRCLVLLASVISFAAVTTACVGDNLREVCGNGQVELEEECDDGNNINDDACRNTCFVASCGDGVLQRVNNELCDDGNDIETDACRTTCVLASCGDGAIHEGVEPCDDGNTDDADACRNVCAPATCGDRVVQTPEECDDGNSVNTDSCANTCLGPRCGDGIRQVGNNEQCDDSNLDDTDGCVGDCRLARCGDGLVRAGIEACDDGNLDDRDACRNNCVLNSCGNGVINGAEECDDGNGINHDSCRNDCIAAEYGDGIVQPLLGELCDDGNLDDTDDCVAPGQPARCGDGFTHAMFEDCDDGNTDDTDACLTACLVASCGDGFVYAGVEECDDGNLSNSDDCPTTCVAAACGDGFTYTGFEECDDANGLDTDDCVAGCVRGTCGDSFLKAFTEPTVVELEYVWLATGCTSGGGVLPITFRVNGTTSLDTSIPDNDCTCLPGIRSQVVTDPAVLALVGPAPNTFSMDVVDFNLLVAWSKVRITYAYGAEREVGLFGDGADENPDLCAGLYGGGVGGSGTEAADEQCDDSNTDDTDACPNTCVPSFCGDGAVYAGFEDCDDGNAFETDLCLFDCTFNPTPTLYQNVGIDTDVPETSLFGWSECYRDTYADAGYALGSIFSQCDQANLMMGCRPTGSTVFTLVAYGPRADVMFDTGAGNTMHVANGVGWYFNGSWSWGFAPPGDAINRNTCDVSPGSDHMCWHTFGDAIDTGWRCGDAIWLNSDPTWERVILQSP